MNPDNLPCVSVARPDVCALANNHVLDFGQPGLAETLGCLAGAGLAAAGAGLDQARARHPVAVPLPNGRGRALVFSCGTGCSGIPPGWAATATRPGVDLLPSLSPAAADALIARTQAARQRGDIVVVSIHWGANWGYQVPGDQVRFARRLIDGGIDLIYGHSSHHPRPIEVYRGKLVLYGCGDCIDDYEGITGYENYRDDLRLLYFASVAPGTGELAALVMVPVQARNMRLRRASTADAGWLAARSTRSAAASDPGSNTSLAAAWSCACETRRSGARTAGCPGQRLVSYLYRPRLARRPVPPLSPGATIHAPAAPPPRCDGSRAQLWGCSPDPS
jgi:poly-gamma-glutamate capsule biosynthesis protein CapA/YwtB (metallophosphatase superfamily)